ncbi:uncharacterized protein LOC106665924 isoform X2 [Cimex lectularius]|uniref:Uncharacterized protein n=1 Tax=Cimex lectularius TaxID=79782 RepID=A0A8I6RKQ7_CIMLE|nr:uncharacterized protein LOC106665924 isoform X2 [Cimex lectularius]
MYRTIFFLSLLLQVLTHPINESTDIKNVEKTLAHTLNNIVGGCKADSLNIDKIKICTELISKMKESPCQNPVLLAFCGLQPSKACPYSHHLFGKKGLPVADMFGFQRKPSLLDPLGLRPKTFNPIITRQKQRRLFEGLLRFATLITQIDEFITEKGKHIISGLNRMVNGDY